MHDLDPSVMVGVFIDNADNQHNRMIRLSFKRRDQNSRDVLWIVFEVSQSIARFKALVTPTFHLHSLKIPVGFRKAETPKGRPLSVMARLKMSGIEVKA
jgi:hypothetical protein